MSVTWLPREGAEPGTTSLLLDAVSAAEWPDGRVFAWLAGEQATIRSLRRHLIRDRGLRRPTSISPATGNAATQCAQIPDPAPSLGKTEALDNTERQK